MIRSITSTDTEWYHTPSGYTTAIGPCSQMRRQSTLDRKTMPVPTGVTGGG